MIWILRVIIYILCLHLGLYWAYFWQIKEYRWDRLVDGIRSDPKKILINQIDLRKWYRPRMTLRTILVLMTTAFFLCLGKDAGLALLIATPFMVALAEVLMVLIFTPLKKYRIEVARRKMSRFGGVVVGITGSYGKTTTKELVKAILGDKFVAKATPKNVNTEIGVAEFCLGLNGKEEVLVIEMGAYKVGEIRSICEMVRPTVGVITGLGDQHLSLFGSLENIKKAKYELIDSLPKKGKALVAERDFGLDEAKNIKAGKTSVSFEYKGKTFVLPLLGKQLIRNVIAAIKVGEYFRLTLEEMGKILSNIDLEVYPRIRKNGRFAVVDDSYNSSLESFLSVIDYIDVWKGYKKILVTSGMIELGANTRTDHKIVGSRLGVFDRVYLSNDRYLSEMNQCNNVEYVGDWGKLLTKINAECIDKTVVVFKGRLPSSIINSIIKND